MVSSFIPLKMMEYQLIHNKSQFIHAIDRSFGCWCPVWHRQHFDDTCVYDTLVKHVLHLPERPLHYSEFGLTASVSWQPVWAKLPFHSALLLNHELGCNAIVISASSLTVHKTAQIANAFGSTSIKHRSIWLTCVQSMSDRCRSVGVLICEAVCWWHMCMTDETHTVLPISRNKKVVIIW